MQAAPAIHSTALSPVLRGLARIRPGPHHVVSCYLRLEVGDRTTRKWLTKLKNVVKETEVGLAALDREARQVIERDLHRVLEVVEKPDGLPAALGAAIFACEPLGLFAIIPLPRVHHTRLSVNPTPELRELLGVQEEMGRLLVAVLDRTQARFFEVGAFDACELPGLQAVATRGGKFHSDRRDSPGRGEHDFHDRIEEERHRHFAIVAERLAALDRQHPAQGVMLAGPAEETSAAARFLSHSLAERYIGSARLNPTAVEPAEVRTSALALRGEFERRREVRMVEELESVVGEGWATNGAAATLRALAHGQVRTLLLRDDLTGAGFRCSDTGRLALSKSECRGEGRPVPVPDLVNEAIEEALRQRVGLVVIHEPDAARRIDGLAALLRFR